MIQAYLDNIKEDAARILREYTNKRVEASFTGDRVYQEVLNESKRLHYFARVIDYLYLVGEVPYLGGTATTDAYVKSVVDKIWHYSGTYQGTELDSSNFETVVVDDGNGGACDPTTPTTTDDHYRSGRQSVTSGTNIITFVRDGVVSPLESADYTLVAFVTLSDGSIQRNLVPSTKTAGGFVVSDILGAGVLEYNATLIT